MSREDSRFRVQTLRSSFTKQALSGMRSSASFGFGTATRDSFSRMYTSQAADKSNVRSRGGNNSSGPAYSPNLSSFGKQNVSVARTATTTMFGTEERGRRPKSETPGPGTYREMGTIGGAAVSHIKTAPKNSFGHATRDKSSQVFISTRHEKSQFAGRASPGPGTYAHGSTLGKSFDSKRPTSPSWKVGTEDRFVYDYVRRARETPGAGTYGQSGAIGAQHDSRRRNAESYSFGGVTRDAASKVFISTRHEKSQFAGKGAPGPGGYNPNVSTFGKQPTSRAHTAPSAKFGTSSRMGLGKSDTPGPGSYYAW